MTYQVLMNSGAVLVVPSGEAKMWALLSEIACNCVVYRDGACPLPLLLSDIR
jgi:hypothetical protein